MASISLTKVIDKMKMENLTPDVDIKPIKVMQPDINRPALQLAGYVEHYESTRLQILGFVEYTYMQSLTEERKKEVYAEVIREGCPGFVFCRDLEPDEIFLEIANAKGVPV